MIKFFNVRSGEVKEAESEPMIAAFFNSSDQNPNGLVQDFGWRLHPDTLKRMRAIQEDEELIERIALRRQILPENVSTTDLLHYISQQDALKAAREAEAKETNYEKEYEAQVRALDEPANETQPAPKEGTAPKKPATPKRHVATPAEIAAQKKKDAAKLAEMLAADEKKGDNKTQQ